MKKNQEKIRRKRAKQTAEDFTPPELVNEMLDKVPQEMFSNPSKTTCDPACGNGNMLIEVLKRRMKYMSPLQAISNIFGCDIMKDNIRELRDRMFNLMPKETMTEYEIRETIRCLLNHFLYVEDALKFNFCFPRKASNENIDIFYRNHLPQSCIIEQYKVSANDNSASETGKEKADGGRLHAPITC